jgi:hypothetical protein
LLLNILRLVIDLRRLRDFLLILIAIITLLEVMLRVVAFWWIPAIVVVVRIVVSIETSVVVVTVEGLILRKRLLRLSVEVATKLSVSILRLE